MSLTGVPCYGAGVMPVTPVLHQGQKILLAMSTEVCSVEEHIYVPVCIMAQSAAHSSGIYCRACTCPKVLERNRIQTHV